MRYLALAAAAAAITCAAPTALADSHGMDAHKKLATGWVQAACGDLEGFIAYVDAHMADDGVFMPQRYVGFGFSFDPNNREESVVSMVTPGTPAAEVLQEGDVFLSVDGVPATWENRDRMVFRGKPGEPVNAVIRRDGEEMSIEVKRGIIASKNDKARSLRGLRMGDAENWPADECEVIEAVGEGNVVYVYDRFSDTEADTGIPYEQRAVTRFEFNDDGEISKVWSLDEGRFVLEQLGYTISR